MMDKYYIKIKKSRLAGYLAAIVCVAFATGILFLFQSGLGKEYTGLVYLLVIAVVAAISGTRPAILAAVLSFLSWDFFFLPPYFTFLIYDQRDWILLIVFLVIGIMTGQITGKMRAREEEAVSREKEISALYRASLSINTQVNIENFYPVLMEQIMSGTGAIGCAIIRDPRNNQNSVPFEITAQAGDVCAVEQDGTRAVIKWAVENAKAVGLGPPQELFGFENIFWPISVPHEEIISDSSRRKDIFLPLCLGDHLFGVLYADPGSNSSFNEESFRLLVTFASIITTAMERQRLIEESAKAVARHESEHLKSVLFSSLSHNLKNPLVSLNTTLSSLRQGDVSWDAETIKELLALMAEDFERLTENINDLLNLAQLESGIWKPKQEWYELREIVSTGISQLPDTEYNRIRVEIPDESFLIWVDSVQMSQVVRHLVENALKYSPAESPVAIGAKADSAGIQLWIDDHGEGIPPEEREAVFTKFYKEKAYDKKAASGTGLGLSICREIIRAHKGSIRIENSPFGGARFIVTLPLEGSSEGRKQ
ncbi:MAG: DUF4118 domain-containing protein [Firmicutes bacterium]|nr:DUF4118 domain-containing protein [Bacillota bacterium]